MQDVHAGGAIGLLGVSNLTREQLDSLLARATVVPTVAQNRCDASTGWRASGDRVHHRMRQLPPVRPREREGFQGGLSTARGPAANDSLLLRRRDARSERIEPDSHD